MPDKYGHTNVGSGNSDNGHRDTDRIFPFSKGRSWSLVNSARIITRGAKGFNKMATRYNTEMVGSINRHGDQREIDRSSLGSKDSSRSLDNRVQTISKGTKGSNRTRIIYNRKMEECARTFKEFNYLNRYLT